MLLVADMTISIVECLLKKTFIFVRCTLYLQIIYFPVSGYVSDFNRHYFVYLKFFFLVHLIKKKKKKQQPETVHDTGGSSL